MLGKLFVAVGIIGILVGGGYYLGIKFGKTSNSVNLVPTKAMLMTPTLSTSSGSSTPTIVSPTIMQKNPADRFAVKAGGIKPFSAYMLSGVGGWVLTKSENSDSSKVVLTKGNYSVTIIQGAFGVGQCIFPGDQPQPMSIALSSSTDIQLLSGNPLRRGQGQSTIPNQTIFSVCQKASNGTYSTFTDFGTINYYTPLNPDNSILAEMDAMIGSLQKQ